MNYKLHNFFFKIAAICTNTMLKPVHCSTDDNIRKIDHSSYQCPLQ
jgi:hypothetical protein